MEEITFEFISDLAKKDIDDVVDWAYYFQGKEFPEVVDIVLGILADKKRRLMERANMASAIQAFPLNKSRNPGITDGNHWTPKLIAKVVKTLNDVLEEHPEDYLRSSCVSARAVVISHGGIEAHEE